MRLHVAVEQDRAVGGPINRGARLRRDDAVERIGILRSGLIDEGSIERGVVNRAAAAKGRLSAELFEHQLFDGVVEDSEAALDGEGAGIAGDFMQPSIAGTRAPGQANAGRPSVVVGLSQTGWDTFVARHNQTQWVHSVRWACRAAICGTVIQRGRTAGGELARILRRGLAGAEGLHVAENVGKRRVQFPTQTVVEGHIRLDAPTVLPEEVVGVVADVFGLRGAL